MVQRRTVVSTDVICRATMAIVGFAAFAAPANAGLVAHFTLDNAASAETAGSGLKNLGTLQENSDLAIATLGPNGAIDPLTENAAPTVVTGLIGGTGAGTGALWFDGVDDGLWTGSKSGDAADTNQDYAFTMSIWMKAESTSGGGLMGFSPIASNNRYVNLGNSNGKAYANRRNGTSQSYTVSNTAAYPNEWQHVVGVFEDSTNLHLFVNGKYIGTETTEINAVSGNVFSVGNLYRTASSAQRAFSAFKGALDDAGVFNTALTAADIALINGLGQTSGLGLNWFEQAQALNAAAIGTTLDIAGQQWQRVAGLSGQVGDYGGSAASTNAYIITAIDGNGIQMVPEPASAAAMVGLGMLLARRQRDRQ